MGRPYMQKSLAKNIFYKVILNVFNLILPIIVGSYAYRTLGDTSIGKVQFSESIYYFFFIFAVFGIYQYGLREMSRIREDKEKVSQFFTSMLSISIITSIVSFIGLLVFAYFGYNDNDIYPILILYGTNLIFNIFYVEWVNEANEDYDFITIKTVIIRLIYVVFLFLLIKGSDDYFQYALLLILSTFLNNIVSFIYVKRRIKLNFKSITIKEHLKPLIIVVIFSNANILFTQLDRFMLGETISTAAVSYYVLAQNMMGIINSLIISIIQVTIPRLSYFSGNDDDESYIALLKKISRVYFAFLFPASIGMLVVSDVTVIIYGGRTFEPAGIVLAVFAIYMISLGTESILSNQIIYVKKKENILVRLIFICGILNVGFNFLLLYLDIFSPATAIFTTAIANYLLVLLEYYYIRKHLKVKYTLFSFGNLKYLLYSLIFIPITYVIRLLDLHTFVLFVVLIIVNIAAYALILFFTKDEVYLLISRKVKEKLLRKTH